jgi:uncharacterized protein
MKPFQLLVKPAAGDCNLACDYCFYRETTPHLYPAEPRHRMSVEIMDAVVKDLLSHRFPETIFCWQGGEPTLMGLDFFEAVIEAQMRHGKGGQVVGNAFQTNGILVNDDWARFFARYQVVVGLSLDGPREVHDHYRKNAGGAGTFERVMAAAETLRRHAVSFNILCVVNRMNQERGREVYRFLRAHGFDYLQFIPCLETGPDGGIMPFSATPAGLGRFYREVFDCYRKDGFSRVSERTFDAVLSLHLTGRPNVCTLGERCGEYLVVEYNGDVYPCDFFVDREWRLGNVMDKKLADFFSHPLMKTFAARKGEVAAECRECGREPWCHGGCLKDRLPGRASGPGRTHFCESYRALFDATDRDMKQWAEEIGAQQAAGPVEASRAEAGPARAPGRNDPCPCGSGKKFKKCCGRES